MNTHIEPLTKNGNGVVKPGKSPDATPQQWWVQLSPPERKLAQQIALMIREISESKRIEIRREREQIRVRFIHILKQPENGCASAIVLPEVPAGWN